MERYGVEKPVLLFDGVCNLCNGLVTFIIKRDPEARLMFASLQSEAGQELLRINGLSADGFDSVVYIYNQKVYTKSTAALHVFKILGGSWGLLYFFIIVPKPIRDVLYRWVASKRYKWFGKRAQCMVPTPDLRDRFLD
ncbi:MAG TPA: thiol-disulfide oxidoreductase DCC family protein [Bacillales bacterium]